MNYLIAPSLLAADATRLGEEITQVMDAGADFIHYDVMDNHYVPNLTFGPDLCAAIHRRFPALTIDVHLMVQPVDTLIERFIQAGAKRISIHPETTQHLDRSLQLIKQASCQAGLVLNPATSPEQLNWCHHLLDYVLIMTVNPGFGGQKLIPATLRKIEWIKKYFPQLPIMVDGGVSSENIALLASAGATQFVAGSAIFSTPDYNETIRQMRNKLAHHS